MASINFTIRVFTSVSRPNNSGDDELTQIQRAAKQFDTKRMVHTSSELKTETIENIAIYENIPCLTRVLLNQ